MGKIKIINEDSHVSEFNPEEFSPFNDRQNIIEENDLSASLKQLNDDTLNNLNMSGIDLRARLTRSDISCTMIVDSLVMFKFLPKECLNITRQKKRLSVSYLGKGREEMVKIIGGYKDQEKTTSSIWSKMTGGK